MELAAFLKAARSRRRPEDVGVIPTRQRRTPGLRREEVAVLANIGISWYSWLEQGRPIKASAQVVNAIADALGLDGAERAHLRILAGLHDAEAIPTSEERISGVGEQLQRIVDSFIEPAYIVDKYWTIEIVNLAARRLIDAPIGSSCLVRFFTEEGFALRFVDQDAAARSLVGRYRRQVAMHIDDAKFIELTESLLGRSDAFGVLWREMIVHSALPEVLVYQHDLLGPLPMRTSTFAVEADPERTLIVHSIDGPAAELAHRHVLCRSYCGGRCDCGECVRMAFPA
ncbi:helix-turn-helix transcriptional regulator [Nocardia sp. NPDC059091]|uniref:helix-turn-helix transcriptional regulator n=1 Tax=unclassified Nocardia TaxID=2637762 RepID=UPI00369044CE